MTPRKRGSGASRCAAALGKAVGNTLHEERPSLQTLKAKHEDDPESLTELEQRRLYKLWNRARIKENNAMLKK